MIAYVVFIMMNKLFAWEKKKIYLYLSLKEAQWIVL